MTTKVLLLSGPNLNLLGDREPAIYGTATLADHVEAFAEELGDGFDVVHVQSNHEGELVDAIQAARLDGTAGIVVNAGALTHYSWAIHDALATFDPPVIELHLSNPDARESWRHTSVVTPVATGIVAGFGGAGYRLAAIALKELLA
jgi:3-dehydroquinate dehydratase type II